MNSTTSELAAALNDDKPMRLWAVVGVAAGVVVLGALGCAWWLWSDRRFRRQVEEEPRPISMVTMESFQSPG